MPESREHEKLRSILTELHSQLEQVGTVDPEVQQLLHSALADLQQAVGQHAVGQPPARSVGAAENRGSLAQRLSDAARHFEESHPALSGTLGSAIDALSRMGI